MNLLLYNQINDAIRNINCFDDSLSFCQRIDFRIGSERFLHFLFANVTSLSTV